MTFDRVLSDIFSRNAERRFQSVEAEREAIAAAKSGDNEATIALMYAYAPAIRNAVERFTGEGHEASIDDEELRSTALLGFAEAIAAFDPAEHSRLASVVRVILARVMREAYPSRDAFTVPARTLTRFYSILRKAEGNVFEAAALAPEYEMTKETFLAVLSAVRNVESVDSLASGHEEGESAHEVVTFPIWDSSEAEDDAVLVAAAFAAVEPLEKTVCQLSYGFTDYDPVPDAEIGHRLGLSRQKTQRTRSAALAKMRQALAVS